MIAKKLAVVTGATGGIGTAVALLLASQGYTVVVHYAQNAEKAFQVRDQILESGGSAICAQADLSSPAGVDGLVEQVGCCLRADPELKLAALVNNAAKLLGPSFDSAQPHQFDEYFALNTRAPFFLTQGLVAYMEPAASVVNLSSASAHFSSPGDIIYAMSKAAVESMTINMAEALAPLGVRVNAVIPGFTDNGHPGFADPAVLEYMSSFSILGGVAPAAVVAEAVAFLVSDRSSRTTGALLDVTGGGLLGARGSRQHSVRDLLN